MNVSEMSFEDRGKLLASVVSPRPLAWITSRGTDSEIVNIAPFNSYCGLANHPPLIGVAFSERDGGPKDTFRNIEETGEFVLNVVTRRLADTMNESAREAGRETDDFARLALSPAPIDGASVPRIAESPAALSCRVESIVDLPPSKCRLVVALVVGAFVADGYDPLKSDVLASVASLQYASLRDAFSLPKVWG